MSRLVLAAAFLALAASALGNAPTDYPLEFRPSDPLLRYNGRFDWREPEAPSASFPGSEVIICFEGAALEAQLSSSRRDEIQVVIDGRPTDILKLTKDPAFFVIGHDLGRGKHTAFLFKRTEAVFGNMRFLGLRLPAGGKLLAAPPARRNLEFVGDSITCGYGDEAGGKEEAVSADNSNHYVSYAAVAARLLGAEHVAVSASGIRLTEYPGTVSMPTVYHRIDPNSSDSHWDFAQGPVPDVVIINLGTNDFRNGDLDGAVWKKSYEDFLDFIRAKRPHAYIFLTNGPMMDADVRLQHLRQWNQEVVARRRAANDRRIFVLDFPIQEASDGYGSDWHPSVKTHARMADVLVAAVKAATGW